MSEAEDLVTVATFANQIEASLAKGPRAELKVKLRDHDRAVEILQRAGHR